MARETSPRRSETVLSSPSSPQQSPRASRSSAIRHVPAITLSSGIPRNILVPTTRTWPTPHSPPRQARPWHAGGRLSKSRPGSIDVASTTPPSSSQEHAWLKSITKFNTEVVEHSVELSGYQILAVEKWLVDRSRAVRTVTVFTGKPEDKILVTILSPVSNLPEAEAKDAFEQAVFELRKDGARPKETEKGVIMITSLANFRSDLNLVHIPRGDFLAARNDLYVNVNLSRMGCSGRSGLTLDEPNSSSKEKFLQMYNITDNTATSPKTWFKSSVLELVRTVQSALALFGLFSLAYDERDGLLCDRTVDGMQKWVDEFGIYLELEPMERVLEPAAVASLLSSVTALRCKLSVIGLPQLPKDPFADPALFLQSVSTFQRGGGPVHRFLDYNVMDIVNTSYLKIRQAEPYKVHRVLKNKIDDLTTVSSSLATNINHSLRSSSEPLPGVSSRVDILLEVETTDIETFTKGVLGTSKHEVPATLRDLWGGRPGYHREKDEEKMSPKSHSKDVFDEDEDSLAGILWRGTEKVQRKGQAFAQGIAEWTGRSKKASADANLDSDTSASRRAHPGLLPSLVITRDRSPDVTDQEERPHMFHSPVSSHRSPASSVANLSDYDRGLRKFNGIAPPLDLALLRHSGVTASDSIVPTLAQSQEGSGKIWFSRARTVRSVDSTDFRRRRGRRSKRGFNDDMEVLYEETDGSGTLDSFGISEDFTRVSRRRSIGDLAEFATMPRLQRQYMQTDVELSWQYVMMRRREVDAKNATRLMQIMLSSLTQANAYVNDALAPQAQALPHLEKHRTELTDLTLRGRREADALRRRVETSKYQVERIEEGLERLDYTLEGYRKRMEDVVRTVEGLYTLETAPPDGENGEGADDNATTSAERDEIGNTATHDGKWTFSWLNHLWPHSVLASSEGHDSS